MPTETADDEIRIRRELYVRLREHCDRANIRFLDFVETALENAALTETRDRGLEQENEALRRKAVKYDYAFNRGFQRGFAFLYLMLRGLNMPGPAEEELGIIRQFPSEAPKGVQTKIF